MTLLLRPPYGNGSGDTISMRCASRNPPDGLEEVMLNYSCHPLIIPNIRACLTGSGRYDCEVQTVWFRHQYEELKADLEGIGIDLIVLRLCDDGYKPRGIPVER